MYVYIYIYKYAFVWAHTYVIIWKGFDEPGNFTER